ncbi:MAG TPA: protein kinase, partial [Actinomycetes bacterium]|nr:protein kinase [Actinomycetes bacterium]
VNAPTLADLVRTGGPLPVERVAEIGGQIASALEAAHQAGIVHRDVKPGNVMVPPKGMAKLADFGIASLQGDPQLTSTGLVIGSPAYMAPEQARGEESGPPVDFWALGATMFYAVEGEPPFDRGTSIATLAAVVNDQPRTPRRAGPLGALITALLAKDPGSRPSGPELRAELSRLAAVPPSPPTEVLPVHGPGRTVPLPAAGSRPAPAEGRPVPDETQPDQRRPGAVPGGVEPGAGAAAAAAAAGLAAAGKEAAAPTPGDQVDATPVPPAARPEPAPTSAPSARAPEPPPEPAGPPATGSPVAPSPATDRPPATPPPAHRASGASAFDPAEGDPPPPGPDPRPPRPLLPPAPVVDRGGRGRSIAVVALLLVLGLVAVLVAATLRSGDDDPTAAPQTTTAGAGGTRPATSTTGAPETTEAPETTKAPTTTAAPGGLPEGWTSFTNQGGSNRVGVPPGFRARTRESFNATVVEEPAGARRVFTVRSRNPSNPLPQASRDYRAGAPGRINDFREVSYKENQTYAGRKGAVVFEYEADIGGRRVHVSHINVKGKTWGYNVEFIVPADQWDASQGLARQFEQAFEPLG